MRGGDPSLGARAEGLRNGVSVGKDAREAAAHSRSQAGECPAPPALQVGRLSRERQVSPKSREAVGQGLLSLAPTSVLSVWPQPSMPGRRLPPVWKA
jgi:hypothetical protein